MPNPTSLDQLKDGEEVPQALLPDSTSSTSPSPNDLSQVPDGTEVEPDATQLRRSIESDPWFPITADTARVLYQDDQKKGFLGRAWETAKAIPSGLSALGHQIAGAHEEMSQVPVPTSRKEVERLSNTLTEAGAEGAMTTTGLVKRAGQNFWDWIKEHATGATDDEKVGDYLKEMQLKQSTDRATRGLPDARPDNYDPQEPSFILKGYGDAPPYAKAAQVLSMPLDPTFMVGAGAVGPVLKAAAKIPGIARAAEAVEAVKNAASAAVPAAAGLVEKTGQGLAKVAKAPEEYVADKLSGIVSPEITHLAGTAGLVGAVGGHGGPVGAVVGLLKGAKLGGQAVEQVAGFFRRLAETSGDQIRSRLLQMAQDPTTPRWMQVAAGKLDALKIGDAAQFTSDLAKGSLHGGVTGAVLATAAGASPEERGEMIGTGLGLGAAGRAARIATGAEAAGRRVLADVGAKQRFLERLVKPADQGGSGLTLDEAKTIDNTTSTIEWHGSDIICDRVQWRVLRPGEAVPGGDPGAAAAFDPVTRTMSFRLGDTTDRYVHELGHAVEQAAGAPGEARLVIDSMFSPDTVKDLGEQYAARLAGSSDPTAVSGKVQQLNDAWKGDQWVYNEIYAEAGFGTLQSAKGKYGASALQGLLGANRSPLQFLRDMARGGFLNNVVDGAFTKDGAPAVPRGAIFNDPAVYNSPELRKMVAQHFNEIRKRGTAALASTGDATTVPMPERLLGKHPSAPKQMLMENGLTLEDRKGNLKRAPQEEKKRDKIKSEQVGGELEKMPVKPKGDTSPEVQPRINSSGEKETTGSKIGQLLAKIPAFGPFAKDVAAKAEALMGSGKALRAGYFAVGTSEGGNWRKSVAKNSGDMPWQQIDLAPFEFKIDSKNHVLITGLSVTAADRKTARWAQEGRLDGLWNGDANQFRNDLLTYLKNHAEGREGSDGLGSAKRDALNLFVVGKLNPAEANPLRASALGKEKLGIIRSLRLDRISSLEDSPHVGWQGEYAKKKINFSPKVPITVTGPDGKQYNATYDGDMDMTMIGRGVVPQITVLDPMPGFTQKTTTYGPSLTAKGYTFEIPKPQEEPKPAMFSPPTDEQDHSGVFYSRLEKALLSLPAGETKPKTGQQWKGWIEKMSRGQPVPTQGKDTFRGGISQDEIKWSGLGDALKDGEKYTKTQVLGMLERNGVQIEEVSRGAYSVDPEAAKITEKYGLPYGDSSVNSLREAGATPEEIATYEEGTNRGAEGNTKFAQYQLPGGKNYKELLLTLPASEPDWVAVKIRDATPGYTHKYEDRDRGGNVIDTVWSDTPERALRIAARSPGAASSEQFRGSHWDEPNVLAHVRFNERTDADGKPVLFLEEVQSDWHQKGRKQGYQAPQAGAPVIRIEEREHSYVALDENGKQWGEVGKGVVHSPEAAKQYLDAYVDTKYSAARLDNQSKVPEAPFKTSWHDLALRRMAKWAADHGFEKIAWITGEQSAERYDLSKQVQRISLVSNGEGSGTYNVVIMGRDGEELPGYNRSGKQVTPGELENLIGKDAAANLIAGADENAGKTLQSSNWYDSHPDDLKVGGEGMRGFYDKILVDSARKLASKLGGEVGTTKLKNPEVDPESGRAWAEDPEEPGRMTLGDKVTSTEVHSLTLPQQSLEKVRQEGVPLFSPDASDHERQVVLEDRVEKVDRHLEDMVHAWKEHPDQRIPWNPVPAARLKRIWLDYGKSGVVRDEKGMDAISAQMLNLIARLEAATILSGHTGENPVSRLNDLGVDFSDHDYDELTSSNFLVNEYSDYAWRYLDPLYTKLATADTAEAKLHIVDRILNVIHARGDLAQLWVQGGTKTLNEIAEQGGYEGPSNQFDKGFLQFSPELQAKETEGDGGVTRLRYYDGKKMVGSALILNSTIGDVRVPAPLRRRGYGSAILQDLVNRGGRSAFAGSEEGKALLSQAGFEDKGDGRFSLPESGEARTTGSSPSDQMVSYSPKTGDDVDGTGKVPRSSAGYFTDRTPEQVTGTGDKGNVTLPDILEHLTKPNRELGRLNERTPENKTALASALADEAIYAISQDKNAIGWYDHKVKEAWSYLEKLHPEFKTDPGQRMVFQALLAITSNGSDVKTGMYRTDELYREYKDTGKLDTKAGAQGKASAAVNAGLEKLQGLIDKMGLQGAEDFLKSEFTVGELKRLGWDIPGELVNTKVRGAMILGPKIGSFYGNLRGDFSTSTMDRWFMRTFNRIAGVLMDPSMSPIRPQLTRVLNALNRTSARQDFDFSISKLRPRLRSIRTQLDDGKVDQDNVREAFGEVGDWIKARHKAFAADAFRNRTELNMGVKNLWVALFEQSEAPENGGHREWIRQAMAETQDLLKAKGIEMSNADLQAVLWYYEKKLYAKFGYKAPRGAPTDYAEAARDLLRDRGESWQTH